MKIMFVASIIRSSLCIIYVFFIIFFQKSLFTEYYFLIVAINLATRGPLYTCLVAKHFGCNFSHLVYQGFRNFRYIGTFLPLLRCDGGLRGEFLVGWEWRVSTLVNSQRFWLKWGPHYHKLDPSLNSPWLPFPFYRDLLHAIANQYQTVNVSR